MTKKTILLLVHGAWHASWCWEKILPLLQQKNHSVIVPDLPGHGKDNTPFLNIQFTTYVEFLCDLIEQLNSPVTLIGHSLGGAIISQVAEFIPEKILKLIYIAAIIPTSGRSVSLEASSQQTNNVGPLLHANEKTNELIFDLDDPSKVKNAFYHCCSEADFQNAFLQLKKEPLSPMHANLTLSHDRFGKIEKWFIECLQDKGIDINNQRRMLKNSAISADKVISLDCDHSPFFSIPDKLAQAILEIA